MRLEELECRDAPSAYFAADGWHLWSSGTYAGDTAGMVVVQASPQLDAQTSLLFAAGEPLVVSQSSPAQIAAADAYFAAQQQAAYEAVKQLTGPATVNGQQTLQEMAALIAQSQSVHAMAAAAMASLAATAR